MCTHTNTTIVPWCTRFYAHTILHRNKRHKTHLFRDIYETYSTWWYNHLSHTTTENYDGNGKGIIFITNTVEMPESYTVAATLRDQWYHWLNNHWRYGSPICITKLIIQIRGQYLTTVLYCLHSRDSVVVHYVLFLQGLWYRCRVLYILITIPDAGVLFALCHWWFISGFNN